jgi:hypothetical protein
LTPIAPVVAARLEDRLQMRERVRQDGERRPAARRRRGRLDQDGEECLGIRRLGIQQLAQQAGRADEVLQVAGVAGVVQQTQSTQGGLPVQGLAKCGLADRERRAQTHQVNACGGLLVATQEDTQRALRVVLGEIGEDLQGGLVEPETLAEHGEYGCCRLRRVGRRQVRQHRARDPLEESAQTPAQHGVVLGAQVAFLVRGRPSVVRVGTGGIGQEGRDLRRLEQRETEGPERAECGSVVELGVRASQLQCIAGGPPRRDRHGGEVLAPECTGLGHTQASRVQG